MTEDEAKTKWCPHARSWRAIERPLNDADTRCIASACMAWRETAPAMEEMWRDGQLVPRLPASGYCGLAGAPQ